MARCADHNSCTTIIIISFNFCLVVSASQLVGLACLCPSPPSPLLTYNSSQLLRLCFTVYTDVQKSVSHKNVCMCVRARARWCVCVCLVYVYSGVVWVSVVLYTCACECLCVSTCVICIPACACACDCACVRVRMCMYTCVGGSGDGIHTSMVAQARV